MLRRLVLGAVIALANGEWLRFAAAADEQADPQSAFEPRSDAGAGQKFLEAFVGDWEVTKKFFPKTGEPVQTGGSCHQTMIHGDRFLKSEFIFQSPGEETTGTGMIGWDPNTKKFTSVWTDARSTALLDPPKRRCL